MCDSLGMDTSQIVFLDTETTNLYPQGEIWELAYILDGEERTYRFKPTKWNEANARALKVGGYYERTADWEDHMWDDPKWIITQLAAAFEGRHIVGAVPNFDENFLRDWFVQNGAVLTTHYHLIDIEAMAVGYLLARGEEVKLPWKSDELSLRCGIEPPSDEERHTALGDARWVKRWFEKISGTEND